MPDTYEGKILGRCCSRSAVEGKPCAGMCFDSFVLGRVLYGMRSLSEELRNNALLEAVLGRIYFVCHLVPLCDVYVTSVSAFGAMFRKLLLLPLRYLLYLPTIT